MALLAIVYGDRGANMTLVSHAEYFIATVFIKSTYNLADFITSRGLLRKKKLQNSKMVTKVFSALECGVTEVLSLIKELFFFFFF